MEYIVKPYESKYREGVVAVLQHLWHHTHAENSALFDWEYRGNPCYPGSLSVVAVNDRDEVIAFRGWVPGIVKVNGEEFVVVRAADAVVAPQARRQGVFTKMTVFSLKYLKEKGVRAIINLSSNEESNPGNRKLGWQILANKNIWYQWSFTFKEHILESEVQMNVGDHSVFLYPYIPLELSVPASDDLSFSMEDGQLDWYAKQPGRHFFTLVAYQDDGKLKALFVVEKAGKRASLQFFYTHAPSDVQFFKILKPYIGNGVISAWGWALSEKNKALLKKMGFYQIPFYERLRKKPPILVRSTGDPNNEDSWRLGGKDIRDCRNWNIQQIDNF